MDSYLTAEISAAAVRWNIGLLRGRLPRGCKLCAVVKADCYGHGLRTLLDVMVPEADLLGVATPDEALLLRRLGYAGEVLVFFSPCAYAAGAAMHEALDELISRNVTLTLATPQEVQAVEQSARRVGRKATIHVKVDSGMGREGISAEQLPAVTEEVRRHAGVALAGVYSHFATADEADKQYAHEQFVRFKSAIKLAGAPAGLALHVANSAAVIDLPETHLDMVRPGIALYGYQPSDEMATHLPLRPAMRLIGRLIEVKRLPAGSPCGYGRTHTLQRDSRVGLVPIGYGDGYLRSLSGRSTMRVGERDVPVCGRISMDQTIVDLTDVPAAAVGDEVEIISPDPAAPHSVENLARLAGTIPYEITCRLGRRIRRTLVD